VRELGKNENGEGDKMDRKISIVIIVLLVLSLRANIALLLAIKARNTSQDISQDITGFSTIASSNADAANAVFENDIVEIDKSELVKCCSFVNADGIKDSCYVLKNYDCSYCSDYCS
jgi:hypothetical protein